MDGAHSVELRQIRAGTMSLSANEDEDGGSRGCEQSQHRQIDCLFADNQISAELTNGSQEVSEDGARNWQGAERRSPPPGWGETAGGSSISRQHHGHSCKAVELCP